MVAGVLPTLRQLLQKVFGDVRFDRVLSWTFGGKSFGFFGKKSNGIAIIGEGNMMSSGSTTKGGKSTIAEDEEKGLEMK